MLNDPNQLKAAALWYVEMQELPIIPVCTSDHSGMSANHKEKCSSPGKTPIVTAWSQKKHTTKEDVEEWFTRNNKLNLGLVLGQGSSWNIVGIDIDGDTGEKLLEEWSGGEIPETWSFRTAQGRRLLYLLPDGMPTKKFKEANKDEKHQELALMAEGQQTVIPPSRHATGFIYAWDEGLSPQDIELAEAPGWVISRIALGSSTIVSKFGVTATAAYSPPVTVEDWTTPVSEGGRNNKLTQLVGSLFAKKGSTVEKVMKEAQIWNHTHNIPPLPEEEVTKMVNTIGASEGMKRAQKEASKSKEIPYYEIAENFIKQQQQEGIYWIYAPNKGRMYRTTIQKGPWVMMKKDEDCLTEIELYLKPIDPTLCTKARLNEILGAMQRYFIGRDRRLEVDSTNLFNLNDPSNQKYIQFQNGMYDWKENVLLPWDVSIKTTLQFNTVWDPEVQRSEEAIELREAWEAQLAEWLEDPLDRGFVQEYLGYCLLPTCNLRTAVFLIGGGKNGKSLFIDCIKPLFGSLHTSVVALKDLAGRFETQKLVNSVLNICGDVDMGYLPETGDLKSLIAGDEMRAEFKYGDSFSFQPVTRYIFSANNLPKTRDKSEGWLSRWKFIHFPKQFKVDGNYKDRTIARFTSELGRLVLAQWAVEGLQRLMVRGDFVESVSMKQTATEYQHDNDNVAAFVDGALIKVPHTGADTMVSTVALHSTYRDWCEIMCIKAISQIEFTKRCQQLGYVKDSRQFNYKERRYMVLLGAQLNPEFPDFELGTSYKMNLSIAKQGK